MATSIPTPSSSSIPATIAPRGDVRPSERAFLPLEPGDRLTRAEFERRWALAAHLKKAELIDGKVYMNAAVSLGQSGAHARVVAWLMGYSTATPGVEGGIEASLRLDQDNEPQPDAFLRNVSGGRSSVDGQGFLCGPPELIVEIASSSVSYDLHDKLNVYRRSGVAEYLVWRVLDRDFDWFVLRDGQYQTSAPLDGILKSEVFPGLWLDKPALLAGDLAKVMAGLSQGLADPSHAAFVERRQDLTERSD